MASREKTQTANGYVPNEIALLMDIYRSDLSHHHIKIHDSIIMSVGQFVLQESWPSMPIGLINNKYNGTMPLRKLHVIKLCCI